MTWLKRFYHRVSALITFILKAGNLIAVIFTIVTFFGAASLVLGFLNHLVSLVTIGIIILALIFAGILYIIFYTLFEELHKKRQSTSDTNPYPAPPAQSDEVVILIKEIVYEYNPDGKTMKQRKRLQIQALHDNVRLFHDRYRWTGRGKCTMKPFTTNFKIGNEYKEESWEYFDVIFPHPLHKDEIFDFTIEWELIDEENKAVPYLSTMIERDTRYLSLQVSLPQELAPKRAYRYIYGNYLETLPIKTEQIFWNPAKQSLNFEVPQPKLFHKYSIRWYND